MKRSALTEEPIRITAVQRQFLYLTAALTGGAILVVEILGAKMLAPCFGTSHFVWTAQITVTLLALAAGYYLGGWWVDRVPRLSRLYFCIINAAIYLCLVVRLIDPLANLCLRLDLALGALLASTALFFVPLTLLATTGPFLVRILATQMSTVGGQVGRLSSVSTLGSVAGTILIGYVLIPHLPNSVTMYLTAGILGLVALVHFLCWPRGGGEMGAGCVLFSAGLLLAGTGWQKDPTVSGDMQIVYQRNSPFGLMQVAQVSGETHRYYLNDYLVQNSYEIVEKKSLSLFTYMLHSLARAHTPQIRNALCIGLGVGIVPMALADDGAQVDVVEINPAVIELAARYFDLNPNKLNITIGDGRFFLNQCRRQYDTLVLDAFLGDASPSHLMTREAFAAMHRVLRPMGTLVINSFGDLDAGQNFFVASLDRTLRQVFRSVRIYADGGGNVFFVASDQPDLEHPAEPDWTQVHPFCQNRFRNAWNGVRKIDASQGLVLTDDFNPADYFDGANRMALRRSLALSMHPM